MPNEHAYTHNPLLADFLEGSFTTSDGVKLRYLRKGEGMPLIMLSGWAASIDAFSLNAPELSETYAVFMLDMRGNGHSEAPAHGAHMARLAADLSEFIGWIGAPKVHLLGWSMGASVIWSYLETFGQELVERVVLVDQSPCLLANPKDSDEEIRLYAGKRVDMWDAYNRLQANFTANIRSIFSEYFSYDQAAFSKEELQTAPDNYYELWQQVPADPPPAGNFLTRLLLSHVTHDWRQLLHTLHMPVLLLTGDASYVTTPEAAQWMSEEMPNCTWVRFGVEEFGDHHLMQHAYKRFNSCVSAFLAGQEIEPHGTADGYEGPLVRIERVEIGPKKFVAHVRIASGGPLNTDDDPEATNRILALFPELNDHLCTGDASPKFSEVIRSTEIAHLLEHVTIELLARSGLAGDISSGRTKADAQGDRSFTIEFACPDDVLVAACLSSAAWVLDWAYAGGEDPSPDVEGIVSGLIGLITSLGDPSAQDSSDELEDEHDTIDTGLNGSDD